MAATGMAGSGLAASKMRLTLVVVALAGLATGLAGLALGASWPGLVFAAATLPVLAALIVEIITSLRRGDVGLDIVAALSMSAALGFGEPLAGNVVALMYAGGQLLESYAEGRARREMTALLGRVARTAMRIEPGGLREVDVGSIAPGDRLLIRKGEVVPVDGALATGGGSFDQSALTGESLPVSKAAGDEVLSGVANAGEAVEIISSRPAAESTYANIVRLVEQAASSRAPAIRIADRFAIWFLFLTLVIAGAAWWASADPIRALAVLVVATPCPLILALPVAIVSGMSRAARSGILIKHGGALETLGRVRTVILDKTGTLTLGLARVVAIRTREGIDPDELLRLAASLDQASNHVIAEALVAEAHARGLALIPPDAVSEMAGAGVTGTVDGHDVVVGGRAYVHALSEDGASELDEAIPPGSAVVAVAIDGRLAGLILLADGIRPEAPDMIRGLRAAGIRRVVLASGDAAEIATGVGHALGLDAAAVGVRARKGPFGNRAVAVHEVAVMVPARIRHGAPHARERRGDRFPAFDARAPGPGPADGVEHAVGGEIGHHAVDVVAVEGVEQRRQIGRVELRFVHSRFPS